MGGDAHEEGVDAEGTDALVAPDTPRMTRARRRAVESDEKNSQSLECARAAPEDVALYPAKVDRCDACDAARVRVLFQSYYYVDECCSSHGGHQRERSRESSLAPPSTESTSTDWRRQTSSA